MHTERMSGRGWLWTHRMRDHMGRYTHAPQTLNLTELRTQLWSFMSMTAMRRYFFTFFMFVKEDRSPSYTKWVASHRPPNKFDPHSPLVDGIKNCPSALCKFYNWSTLIIIHILVKDKTIRDTNAFVQKTRDHNVPDSVLSNLYYNLLANFLQKMYDFAQCFKWWYVIVQILAGFSVCTCSNSFG